MRGHPEVVLLFIGMALLLYYIAIGETYKSRKGFIANFTILSVALVMGVYGSIMTFRDLL